MQSAAMTQACVGSGSAVRAQRPAARLAGRREAVRVMAKLRPTSEPHVQLGTAKLPR